MLTSAPAHPLILGHEYLLLDLPEIHLCGMSERTPALGVDSPQLQGLKASACTNSYYPPEGQRHATNAEYTNLESRIIHETGPIDPRRSQCSPSTSGSLTSDTEPPAHDSAAFSAEFLDNRPDNSWLELPGSTHTQLHGSRGIDNLWLDDQFDLEAMGSAILDANHLPGLSNEPFVSVALSAAGIAAADDFIATFGAVKRQMEVHKAVHSRWYTRPIPEPGIPQPLVSFMNREEVDEEYRVGLSTRLAPNPQDIALPSAEFLAILASWERYIHKGGCEALAVAQAATIGQTYGILSGQPNDLLLTESFHGTIIAWARQAGLFRVRTALESTDTIDMTDIEGSWRRWAQREETLRLILALQIHDSEFTKIFHHEGLLGHDQNRLPTCCSAELFSATTASNWHAMVTSMTQTACNGEDPVPGFSPSQPVCKSTFYAYAQLAGHYAHLSEARCRGALEDHATTIRQRLTLWYDEIVGGIVDKNHDQFSLMGLWHQAFMALYVDFDFLERIVGRDETPPTSLEEDEVSRWVRSNDGIRCVVHAALIIKRHSMQAITEESAIHVPLSLFYAGIVVYCYIKFGGLAIQRNVDIMELNGSEASSTVITEKMGPSTLYTVTDILRRHGHWDLSRRLASILSFLIEEVTNSEMQ
ncbi:hypothetical protein FACUT_13565 [Fusarium acutatum]|uniref:Transcription factor domain-containing protein n=1 Tax=Fusarium acutatum TaxID=78861 RepID=A0A8H4J8Y3_9HYPO|nr:hypothetical protein FACUT_13565 [Fusarium acutatum]